MDPDNPFPFGGGKEFKKDERLNLYFGSPQTRQSSPATAYPEYYDGSNNKILNCAGYYGYEGYGYYGCGCKDHENMSYVPYEAFTSKFEGLSLKEKVVPKATDSFLLDQTNANLQKRNVLDQKEKHRRDAVLCDLVGEGQHIPMYSQAKPGEIPRSHSINSKYQEQLHVDHRAPSCLMLSGCSDQCDADTYALKGCNASQYSPFSPLSSPRKINYANDIRNFSENISTRTHATNMSRSLRSNCIANYQSTSIGNKNLGTIFNGYSYETPFFSRFKSSELKLKSVDDAKKNIYYLAKDQWGCHFLKSMLKEDSPENVDKIFIAIIDCIVELMTNPFGNIVVQELLGVCNEEQRVRVLYAITGEPGELLRISLNTHGSRVVQKVIETLHIAEQVRIFISSLMPGIVSLMKHINGSHVVQCCLRFFSSEHCKFIISAAILYCVELGSDSRGCCVLQKCLERAEGGKKNQLIYEICLNSYFLSKDAYGNYLVQFMLDLGVPQATTAIIDQLKGRYKTLAMQVHGSNVVEKCLNLASEEYRAKIVHEFIRGHCFFEIATDKYGNYVIQTALKVCKGALLCELVEAIRRYRSALRCNKYGRKVVDCFLLRKVSCGRN